MYIKCFCIVIEKFFSFFNDRKQENFPQSFPEILKNFFSENFFIRSRRLLISENASTQNRIQSYQVNCKYHIEIDCIKTEKKKKKKKDEWGNSVSPPTVIFSKIY